MSSEEIEKLHRGGLLHDIGKIGVPADVLDKPGALNAEEMQIMRSHVTVGARILEPIASYRDVIPVVLYHHEWFNGNGYPEGLKGDDIPLLARVLAVPDVFDAITSDRPYRMSLGLERACEVIRGNAGTHFDPEVVEAFMSLATSRELPHGDHLVTEPGQVSL